jgi:hypothetical protein
LQQIFAVFLLPILAWGAATKKIDDGDSNTWNNEDSFTLNPKASSEFNPKESVVPTKSTKVQETKPPNSPMSTTEEPNTEEASEHTESQEQDEIMPLILRKLLEQELLKQSLESKLPEKNQTDSDKIVQAVKTPLVYMTPPPPLPETIGDDLYTTTSSDFSEETDDDVISTTLTPNVDSSLKQSNPDFKKKSTFSSESGFVANDGDNNAHGVKPYAENYKNYQPLQTQRMMPSDEQETNGDRTPSRKASEADMRQSEITDFRVPSTTQEDASVEDDVSTTTEGNISTTESTTTEITPTSTGFNGMDKVVFDNTDPSPIPTPPDATPVESLDSDPKSHFYMFMRPRPLPISVPNPNYQFMYPNPPSDSENLSPSMTRVFTPTPTPFYPMRTNPWMQPLQYRAPVMMPSYNPTMTSESMMYPQRSESAVSQSLGGEQFGNTLPIPVMATPNTFRPYMSAQQQRPYEIYPSAYAGAGLGFPGDYFRRPYWNNPYPVQYQYQRSPNMQYYYSY